MARTSTRIVFPDVEFSGSDVKSAKVVEEFHPLSVTVPINTAELVLFSDDTAFSIINPSGRYESLINRQPMSIYESVNGVETFIGQYFLEDWESQTENLKRFRCVDILGILDKYDYRGGIWLTPVKVGDLLSQILGEANVDFEIDPDVAAVELTGWLPICTYREALQQVLFAASAYILVPRVSIPIIARIAQVTTKVNGPHLGHPRYRAGTTRVGQYWFRPTQSIVYTAGNAVTRGERAGVFRAGVSRVRQHWFRQGQWEGIKPTYDIPDSMQSGRRLNLRPPVTGVEVTAHDITVGDGMLELFNGNLGVGDYEIRFSQPMHTLTFSRVPSGGTIVEAGANYCIVRTLTPGVTILNGLTYTETKRTFSRYVTNQTARDNVLRVTDATLVNSTNGESVCEKLFHYYQQRYIQTVKFFSTSLELGSNVNAQTLYNNNLFGLIEKASTNLAQGNVSTMEIIGIITGQYTPGG